MKAFLVREWCAFGLVVVALVACQPRTPAQAEALYTAEQLACVEHAASLDESRECRAKIDQKWGVSPRKGSK